MNLKKGDLYFIGERDLLTGAGSAYFKIGLVKASRRGDSENRLGEHQTGNPRQLSVVEIVTAPAISDLEKRLHHEFATDRILGEWFEFTAEALDSAVRTAQALAAEQWDHIGALLLAKELASVESTLEEIEPVEDDYGRFAVAHAAKHLGSEVKRLRLRCDAIFRSALEAGKDVQRYATNVPKKATTFRKEALAEEHPDLYASYVVEKEALTPLFLLKKPNTDGEFSLPSEFETFSAEMDALMDLAQHDDGRLEQLHLARLGLLKYESQAKWDRSLAEANLRARCGASSGIAGLVSWARKVKVEQKFDDAAFKADHPTLAAQFTETVDTSAFVVSPMRSYALEAR
ncbi:MAG: hypothetical protein RLZZ269_5 [Actinomycetota bacterium]